MAYPGTRNHKIEIPVTTRSIARAMARAIATDKLTLMAPPGIAPALTSSICFSSTATAGSAEMMNQPSSAASGISSHSVSPVARAAPSSAPRLEKPTFTPARNSTKPT